MKRLMILILCITAIQFSAKASDDIPIEFGQLPQDARTFVGQYFSNTSIALVKMDDDFFDKSYEVIFTNGSKIEFTRTGIWKEVDCRYSQLPKDIVPLQIQNYVSSNYPNTNITKIEKESRGKVEVQLNNGLELTFDSRFNLIDIDN